MRLLHGFLILIVLFCAPAKGLAAGFTVATWNLEFYVDRPTLGTEPKTAGARALIRKGIRQLNADILALQEMGSSAAFEELKDSLKKEGLEYPYSEFVRAWDTNLHLAFLSRWPIVARHPHTNETFLFQGRRHRSARGFGEIEVQLPGGQRVTFLSAHLKSKRIVAEADQQGLREEEAGVLREIIDDQFARAPARMLIVLGDFNDDVSSRTLKTVLGRGRTRLFDTRPFERNGDSLPSANPRYEPRRIVWTHYFGKEETYGRLDYILASPNLKPFYQPAGSFVLAMPDWGAASDHRPVCARFEIQ